MSINRSNVELEKQLELKFNMKILNNPVNGGSYFCSTELTGFGKI